MKIAILIFMLIFASEIFALKEGVLAFSDIAIESKGIGNSGPIKLIGKTANGKYRLKLQAFSKEYVIPDSIISKLKYSSFNGIRLSYEAGYKELGGKTVYIIIEFGFTSGLTDSLLISVTENGKIHAKK